MEKHSRSLEAKNNKKCFILRNKKEDCVFSCLREIFTYVCWGGVSKYQEKMIIQRVLKDLADRAINSSSVRWGTKRTHFLIQVFQQLWVYVQCEFHLVAENLKSDILSVVFLFLIENQLLQTSPHIRDHRPYPFILGVQLSHDRHHTSTAIIQCQL